MQSLDAFEPVLLVPSLIPVLFPAGHALQSATLLAPSLYLPSGQFSQEVAPVPVVPVNLPSMLAHTVHAAPPVEYLPASQAVHCPPTTDVLPSAQVLQSPLSSDPAALSFPAAQFSHEALPVASAPSLLYLPTPHCWQGAPSPGDA